ncbi:MAG: hypothetical protein KDE09_17015 [Anaerolineales bacterium]|nr:hypothetical protein [Anaerolineales bacterium]
MATRKHATSLGAVFLSILTFSFLFVLTQCAPAEDGESNSEFAFAPTYTRLFLATETPSAGTMPATFTPSSGGQETGLSSGQAGNGRGEPTATPDLTGYSTIIEVRRTGEATGEPVLIPTAIASASPASATTAPVATGAPTPTSSAGQGNATPTPKIEPTNTTSPPTNTPQPSATPNLNFNPRKGIAAAYAWAYDTGYEPFNTGWYYTWSLFPGEWVNSGMEFIPMWPCHGTVDYVVGTLGADYDGYLLFLNEPERPEQCTHSIEEAVDYYLMVRNALPQAKLIGPQTIGSTNLNFSAWIGAWREAVRQRTGSYPDVAGYGFHLYPYYLNGVVTPRQVMQTWCDGLASWGELGTKEIWVTEFGVENFDGTPQQVQDQLTSMVNLFEQGIGNCQLDRYAYFTDRRVAIQGAPTPTIAPGGPNYFDLYWRNSWDLSYVGQAYANVANGSVAPANPTSIPQETKPSAAPSPIPIRTLTPSPTPTPSPTAVVTPAPSAIPQPLNPRKGIAATYAWAYDTGFEPFRSGWYYTWSLFPGEWANSSMEFIPMWPCHGTVDYVVGSLGADYDGYLLFLNEPDRPEQCGMSVEEAVDYYLTVRTNLPHAKLIGPQTISSIGGDFAGWTRAWREQVRTVTGSYPELAGYGLHIYPLYNGEIDTLTVLKDWCQALNDWGEVGQSELWITEFGVENFDGTPDEVRAELEYMVNLFENGVDNCSFDRYAYFTDRRAPAGTNPNPNPQPGGPNYFDLYWRGSWQLSYTGQAYADLP